jgi:excinuclease ABC subunit B
LGIFKLKAPFEPSGDQPQAIEKLIAGVRQGERFQTLVGVTGSGKTFTMANVIREFDRPVLILSHNKTLAAQLYSEFKAFFPENAVEYFVSYYDYYQPEAYVPTIDLYISKDADINDDIARLRHSTIRSLVERRDVIVVSSISCIYGWDSPEEYREGLLTITQGAAAKRDDIVRSLIGLRYERVEDLGKGGTFRVRGSTIEVLPKETETGIRIRLALDGTVEKIQEFDLGSRQVKREYREFIFFPAAQFVTSPERIEKYLALIQTDLDDRIAVFKSLNKYVEAQRIEERTKNDMEMLREAGYCNGIENYSRYFSGRAPGSQPYTLLSFLPEDFLLFIDESHISVPQIRGMFNGDHQRKQTLIDYGFRLPSALDNRPLTFDEFMRHVQQAVFVSATPSEYEHEVSTQVAEQLLRPTGLVDPLIEVRPSKDQVPNLIAEIRQRIEKQERVLVTTLTKKGSELLADYLQQEGIKSQYLHSDLDALARVHILRQLRSGEIDVLVGVNLLREGLDLPEVSLVAILDADKEGFLRSDTSLLQTMGRAARNVSGTIIMYADEVTGSMSRAMAESRRRREYQLQYNEEHGITPQTIHKAISELIDLPWRQPDEVEKLGKEMLAKMSPTEVQALVIQLNEEMLAHAESLEFEEAARLRDKIAQLRAMLTGDKPPTPQALGLMPRMGRHKHR